MPQRLSPVLTLALLLAAVLAIAVAGGISDAEAGQSSRVSVPAPAKGKGDSCVAETEFMRRYHMTVLNHQRDDTVHDGIRTRQFSLRGCIACHAVEGADARPVTYESPQHFCRTCHEYAAVQIDCFQCHASRPEDDKAAGNATEPNHRSVRSLAEYLERAQQ